MHIPINENQRAYDTVEYEGNPAGQDIPRSQESGVYDDFDNAQFESLTIFMTTSDDICEKRDKMMWTIKM